MLQFSFRDFLDDLFDQTKVLLFTWPRTWLLQLCLELLRIGRITHPSIHRGQALQMLQPLMFPLQILVPLLFLSPSRLILFFIDGAERALPVIKLTILDLILPHETIQPVQFNTYRHCLACYLPYLWGPILGGGRR